MGILSILIVIVIFIIFFTFLIWLYDEYKTKKTLGIKHIVVFVVLALVLPKLADLSDYLVKDPDSFEAAIEILKEREEIKSRIGYYNGCSWDTNEMPKHEDNPAVIKVTLTGTKGSVYIHCVMKLSNSEIWELKEILEQKDK